MNISDYRQLILGLPVREQSFSTKRTTWLKAESEVEGLTEINNRIFADKGTITISRGDIFKRNAGERFFMTIYWGYPSGMRGRNFIWIAQQFDLILNTLIDFVNNNNAGPTAEDFKGFVNKIKSVPGLGLSTYSKLLYFFEPCIDHAPCLILDQRLINCFALGIFSEFRQLEGMNYNNAQTKYLQYLRLANDLANKIGTHPENIEQFLYLFGNNLKPLRP